MKNKYIVYVIVMIMIVSIGVSYSYFVSSNSMNQKEIKITSKDISIVLTDNMVITDTIITPGWNTSKTFTVKNNSDEVFNYNIIIKDLINTFATEGYLQYKITSENGYETNGYIDIPKRETPTDTVIAYDIDINPGVLQEYTIEFIYRDSDTIDQSEDMGKVFSGTLAIVEGTIDPNKFYTVTLEIENGRVIDTNPKTSLKNGSVTYEVEPNTGYEISGSIECSGTASGSIDENTVTISGIKENQTCTVNTSKKSYTLSIGTNNANMGTVSPASPVIEHGSDASITLSPKTGYKYSSNNCGGTVSGNTMTISNVTEAKTCTVTFAVDESKLLYNKILADHPTRPGKRTNFSSVFTTNNTKTLYTEDGNYTEGGKTVYYFAGNATDNWVYFGGFYWRIIRINEDNSVRLLYLGESTNTTSAYIKYNGAVQNHVAYNSLTNNTMYVGYMYGSTGSLANNRNNTTNSPIKTIIDNWYASTLNTNYNGYVSQTAIYCNDRSSGAYTASVYGNMNYAAYQRLVNNKRPSYKCGNNQSGTLYSDNSNADKFTKSTTTGNGKLTYPIALMTADEVAFAGGLYPEISKAWYYYNSAGGAVSNDEGWWLMSPAYYQSSGNAGVFMVAGCSPSGCLNSGYVSKSNTGIRPVLSLKSCVTWTSGDGSATNPYKVSLTDTCKTAVN